jgi:hypothetical protein
MFMRTTNREATRSKAGAATWEAHSEVFGFSSQMYTMN